MRQVSSDEDRKLGMTPAATAAVCVSQPPNQAAAAAAFSGELQFHG